MFNKKGRKKDALKTYTSSERKTSRMIMPTKHKMVLCLRRLIFDSPLTRFLSSSVFLLQHHHLQYTIRGKKARERSLNYGRCLQSYTNFAIRKKCRRKFRQLEESHDKGYTDTRRIPLRSFNRISKCR